MVSFTTHFNCKQSENSFSQDLLLNQITDTKIINRGTEIRMSSVDFIQRINKQGMFILDSRLTKIHAFLYIRNISIKKQPQKTEKHKKILRKSPVL